MMLYFELMLLKNVVKKDAFDALKEAGITAFAIYDRTLEKANDAGVN